MFSSNTNTYEYWKQTICTTITHNCYYHYTQLPLPLHTIATTITHNCYYHYTQLPLPLHTIATTITQNSSQHRVKYKSSSLKLLSHIAKTRTELLRVNERNSYQKPDPTRKINIERHNSKL